MIEDNLINSYLNRTTNVTHQGANSAPVAPKIPETKEDKLAFLDMYSDLQCVNENTDAGSILYEGTINGQKAMLKSASNYGEGDNWCLYQEGVIGDKELFMIMTSKSDDNTKQLKFNGEYNNKQLDLTLEYPFEKNKFKRFWKEKVTNNMYIPDKLSIKGTINGKEVEMQLPGAKVPRDADQKDVVTTMLRLSGYAPSVMGGKIVSLAPGARRINSFTKKQEDRKEFWHDPIVTMILGATVIPLLSNGLTAAAKGLWKGAKVAGGAIAKLLTKAKV